MLYVLLDVIFNLLIAITILLTYLHTLMTSRSQGQSQGHEGHFRFFCRFCMYSRIVLMGLLCILDRGIKICCDLLSTLLDVADPISLDVLVFTGNWEFGEIITGNWEFCINWELGK